MTPWTDIKDKILFSYMEADWTSIKVHDVTPDNLESFLRHDIGLNKIDKDILKFENSGVSVYLYKNSDQHFDFDPREVKTMDQWEQFLLIFKRISKTFKTDVLFRPEDNGGDSDSVLVTISGEEVKYNFKVKDNYTR